MTDSMLTHESDETPPLFEGVGDEVLIVGAVLLLTALILYYCCDFRTMFPSLFGESPVEGMAVPMRPYNGGTCPICLQNTFLGLETNCGHVFCGRCMINYWHHGNFGMSAMKCALCRQQVNMLFTVFSPDEVAALETSNVGTRRQALLREMYQYNRTFSGQPRTYWQMVRDSPVLVRHLLSDFLSEGGIMRMFQLRIIFCVLGGLVYVFSPLDVLPEALFGLMGLVDDLLVLLMLFVYLSTIYHRIMVSRANAVMWDDSDVDD